MYLQQVPDPFRSSHWCQNVILNPVIGGSAESKEYELVFYFTRIETVTVTTKANIYMPKIKYVSTSLKCVDIT